MTLEDDSSVEDIDLEMRREYITTAILPHIIDEEKVAAYARSDALAIKYTWPTNNALNVLALAAQKGCFDEFAQRLEDEYQRNLNYTSPNAKIRTTENIALRKTKFLSDCLTELKERQEENPES